MDGKRVKKIVLGAIIFLFAALLVQLVSAASFGAFQAQSFIQNMLDNINAILTPILTATFGQYYGYDFLFAKFLVFILLFVMIRTAVKSVPSLGKSSSVTLIVALVVSILSMRFISEDGFFKGILLPYGVLGIALTTLLPFMIYFFFVHNSIQHGSGRRLAFIFFLVIFGVLWYNRYPELDSISNYIYLATMILCVCAMLFDRQVKRYFRMGEIEKATEEIDKDIAMRQINKYYEALNTYKNTGQEKWLKHAAKIKERMRKAGYELP